MKNWPQRPPGFGTPVLSADIAERRRPRPKGDLTYAHPVPVVKPSKKTEGE